MPAGKSSGAGSVSGVRYPDHEHVANHVGHRCRLRRASGPQWTFCHYSSAIRQYVQDDYTAKKRAGTARNAEKILRRNTYDQLDNRLIIKLPKLPRKTRGRQASPGFQSIADVKGGSLDEP
jgi:hypothetical protein